jgi:DNA-binding NarL/FixJ family response regulator
MSRPNEIDWTLDQVVDLLRLRRAGLSERDIAKRMGLSHGTVHGKLYRLLRDAPAINWDEATPYHVRAATWVRAQLACQADARKTHRNAEFSTLNINAHRQGLTPAT